MILNFMSMVFLDMGDFFPKLLIPAEDSSGHQEIVSDDFKFHVDGLSRHGRFLPEAPDSRGRFQ